MSYSNEGWYFAVSTAAHDGPVTLEALRTLHVDGKVTDGTLVWQSGMSGWLPYGEVFKGEAPPRLPGAVAPPPLFAASTSTPPPRFEPGALPAAAADPDAAGQYAPFWRRALAATVDSLIIGVASYVVGFLLGLFLRDPTMVLGIQVVTWIGSILYYVLTTASSEQGTLGKQALGIKVTTLEGERIDIGRSTGRYFSSIVSSLILGIGYLMAFFSKRRQGLHDRMAGTLVLMRATTPEDVRLGLPAPRTSGGDVATLILLGLVPVVGILAAIAIPAYQDYLIRAQVASGLTAAAPYKAAVAEAYANDGNGEPLTLPANVDSPYVEAIEVDAGVVVIHFGAKANAKLSDASVALIPSRAADESIVWTCGYAAVPDDVEPLTDEDSADYTTVSEKYLPATCR